MTAPQTPPQTPPQTSAPIRVDLGIFAHDEAEGIGAMLAQFAAQDWAPFLDLRLLVLANGCRDQTVARARAAAESLKPDLAVEVVDLAEGGKSRTWNRFVHDLSRPGAEVLIFCDADITLADPRTLAKLARGLVARPGLWALTSRPVKDLAFQTAPLTRAERLILKSGEMLDSWKSSICGQLYAMPAARARGLHLPHGLPTEDGFLRALVLTGGWSGPEDFSRIDGLEDLHHIYPSERQIAALIRHQVRLVIGSALNWACYRQLDATPPEARAALLARADAAWLEATRRAWLPRWPWGYVPAHFLTKRLVRAWRAPGHSLQPRRLALVLLGTGFDLVVWLRAQWAMARGTGVGHW